MLAKLAALPRRKVGIVLSETKQFSWKAEDKSMEFNWIILLFISTLKFSSQGKILRR